MRVAIINPWLRTVTCKEIADSGIDRIYEALTCPGEKPVDDFNVVTIAPRVSLYVDGEGFLKPDVPVFTLLGYQGKDGPLPLAGMGILFGGVDYLGDDKPLGDYISEAFVRDAVTFTNQASTGHLHPTITVGNTTTIGAPILKEREA